MKKKTGVILFSLALGLLAARPAPAAAADFTWDVVCAGNPLATCASVSVSFGTTAFGIPSTTLSVTNWLSGGTSLNSFGLGGSGFAGFPTDLSFQRPFGWSYSVLNGGVVIQGAGGIGYGQTAAFRFTGFGGGDDFEGFVSSLNGNPIGGEGPEGRDGLGPDPQDVGTTHAPEPTSLILLGTGLVGMAVIRNRRKKGFEEQ